jgi:hypothetical protein
LTAGDSNGKADVYQYDLLAGQLTRLTSGHSETDSYFVDSAPSGRDAFFLTRERLVGWDRDANLDLYDARIGGGLPEPPAGEAPCQADACQGPPSTPPPVTTPGSSLNSGPAPRAIRRHSSHRKCAKGKKRQGNRCTKKKPRQAKGGRRTGASAGKTSGVVR